MRRFAFGREVPSLRGDRGKSAYIGQNTFAFLQNRENKYIRMPIYIFRGVCAHKKDLRIQSKVFLFMYRYELRQRGATVKPPFRYDATAPYPCWILRSFANFNQAYGTESYRFSLRVHESKLKFSSCLLYNPIFPAVSQLVRRESLAASTDVASRDGNVSKVSPWTCLSVVRSRSLREFFF